MAEQGNPEAPQKQDAPAPTMTSQVFIDKVNELIDEANAAGLRPTTLLLGICVKQGIGKAQLFLAALEDGNIAKGKKN